MLLFLAAARGTNALRVLKNEELRGCGSGGSDSLFAGASRFVLEEFERRANLRTVPEIDLHRSWLVFLVISVAIRSALCDMLLIRISSFQVGEWGCRSFQ